MSDIKDPSTDLENVISKLCDPNDGCEWDRAQTPESLCDYIIEEAHELVDAIRHGTDADVREELGDVFFLLYFISHLYAAKGTFTREDALAETAAKMIRRHPHVFAGITFPNLAAQLKAWETIKKEEKKEEGKDKGVFDSLPRSLPSLVKAYRIHSKAARAGFTWDSDEDVEQQVEAEWLELIDALAHADDAAKEHEYGDILFSMVELGRRKGIKASAALDFATQRFLDRFARMEEMAREKGKEFSELDMDEKNDLWDIAKGKKKQNDL